MTSTSSSTPYVESLLLEMRWRCVSLAADLDRLETLALASDHPRLVALKKAIPILLDSQPNRAARVEMIFSDVTPPPAYRQPQPQTLNPAPQA